MNINVQKLLAKLQQDVENVLTPNQYGNNLFFGGPGMVRESAKFAMYQELNNLHMHGAVDNYKCDVGEDENGCIQCDIILQPVRSAQNLKLHFVINKQLRGLFYVKPIRKRWCLCTEKDVYQPDYEPMVASIGDDPHEWELFTEGQLLDKGIDLDEIMTYFENFVLQRKE
jgi:hypothetical protein